jgi:hypothetical protein
MYEYVPQKLSIDGVGHEAILIKTSLYLCLSLLERPNHEKGRANIRLHCYPFCLNRGKVLHLHRHGAKKMEHLLKLK